MAQEEKVPQTEQGLFLQIQPPPELCRCCGNGVRIASSAVKLQDCQVIQWPWLYSCGCTAMFCIYYENQDTPWARKGHTLCARHCPDYDFEKQFGELRPTEGK